MGHKEGYILPHEVIFDKIQETHRSGRHRHSVPGRPASRSEDRVVRRSAARDQSEVQHLVPLLLGAGDHEYRGGQRPLAAGHHCAAAGCRVSIPFPGGGAEILDDAVRHRISRLKCGTQEWIDVHRTAHSLGMRTTATMMFGCGETHRAAHESFRYRAADSGRNGRIHGLYPLGVPARADFARAVSSRKKRRRSST